MFHLFQTYVTEVLSFCNISRRRKRAHADAVPGGLAIPTCMHISRHEGHNRMRRCTSMQGRVCRCSNCMWDVQAQRVACGAGFFWKRRGKLSSMRGRRDGRSRRGGRERSDTS